MSLLTAIIIILQKSQFVKSLLERNTEEEQFQASECSKCHTDPTDLHPSSHLQMNVLAIGGSGGGGGGGGGLSSREVAML